jgi:hypothetical protein
MSCTIPFKWRWRAFWWGFFHPFVGDAAQLERAEYYAHQMEREAHS